MIVMNFPKTVRVIEHTLIPLKDGTMLAARIWLPDDAEQNPVPAILEYLPYRKRDGTYERDALTHPYLAGHGYAGVRVDIRGSGESGGLLFDEYAKQEQDDGVEVIAWLASQPWCSGVVGMMGISWGGFNGLQIAARRPPALKAIVTICSTDDRYADDAHYMGGALLAVDGLEWPSFFFASMCLPPDPMLVGDSWRAMWMERLDFAQVNDGIIALNNRIIPVTWVVRTKLQPFSLSADVQRELREASGGLPVAHIRSMQQVVGESTARNDFYMTLLTIFAGIALLLAAIGVYGLMAYSVQQRTQEIGVRMALGASAQQVRRMVVIQGMQLALVGVIIGVGSALGLTRLMSSLLYGVKPWDPITIALVAVLLSGVTLLATYLPARRASRVDPMVALRYE